MTDRLPTCLVVGPQKAGTSWLHEYFHDRDDFALPKGVKETFFFDQYHGKGLGWYKAHFTSAGDVAHIAEVAPTYFEDAEAPERIKAALGDIPIICTFRDPADRTFSLWQHMRRYGMTKASFRESVERDGILDGSLYGARLAHWESVFTHVTVMFMSDLAADSDAYVSQISSFLGVPHVPVPDRLQGAHFEAASSPNFYVAKVTNIVAQTLRSLRLYSVVNWLRDTPLKGWIFGKPNPDAPKEKIAPEDRKWLLETYLNADIDVLEARLGRTFDKWRT